MKFDVQYVLVTMIKYHPKGLIYLLKEGKVWQCVTCILIPVFSFWYLKQFPFPSDSSLATS